MAIAAFGVRSKLCNCESSSPMPKDESVGMTKSQLEKFKEAARELDTNDSEQDFDVLVKRIAKSPPLAPKVPEKQVPKKS